MEQLRAEGLANTMHSSHASTGCAISFEVITILSVSEKEPFITQYRSRSKRLDSDDL